MDDREKLYEKASEAYFRAMAPAMSEDGIAASVENVAVLPYWRAALDAAYEAGLVDGAKMLAAAATEKSEQQGGKWRTWYSGDPRFGDGFSLGRTEGDTHQFRTWTSDIEPIDPKVE